jgi:hypothetical protein
MGGPELTLGTLHSASLPPPIGATSKAEPCGAANRADVTSPSAAA